MSTIVTPMPIDIRPSKAELRAEMLAQRNRLTDSDVAERSAAIAEGVCRLPIFTSANTIAGYMPIGREVQTQEILRVALAAGKRVALPRTVTAERRLVLHAVDDLSALIPGVYGILEPPASAPVVEPSAVDLFLVPGAAFDAAGNRLGYGGGYYDSLLVLSEGWRAALAFSSQLVAHVPVLEHDMPVDLIMTELGPIDCGQGQQASDHLRLRNLTFYGYHGAFPQERQAGIRLTVDIDLRLDLQIAGLTDDLATTVNYPAVYRLINRLQSGREYALFEALVGQIATAILQEFSLVREVTVTARKFNPPIGGLLDAFEVQVTRSRPAWMRPPGG